MTACHREKGPTNAESEWGDARRAWERDPRKRGIAVGKGRREVRRPAIKNSQKKDKHGWEKGVAPESTRTLGIRRH